MSRQWSAFLPSEVLCSSKPSRRPEAALALLIIAHLFIEHSRAGGRDSKAGRAGVGESPARPQGYSLAGETDKQGAPSDALRPKEEGEQSQGAGKATSRPGQAKGLPGESDSDSGLRGVSSQEAVEGQASVRASPGQTGQGPPSQQIKARHEPGSRDAQNRLDVSRSTIQLPLGTALRWPVHPPHAFSPGGKSGVCVASVTSSYCRLVRGDSWKPP